MIRYAFYEILISWHKEVCLYHIIAQTCILQHVICHDYRGIMLVCNFERGLLRLAIAITLLYNNPLLICLYFGRISFAFVTIRTPHQSYNKPASVFSCWLTVGVTCVSLCQSDCTTQSGESVHHTEQDSWLEDSGYVTTGKVCTTCAPLGYNQQVTNKLF